MINYPTAHRQPESAEADPETGGWG